MGPGLRGLPARVLELMLYEKQPDSHRRSKQNDREVDEEKRLEADAEYQHAADDCDS